MENITENGLRRDPEKDPKSDLEKDPRDPEKDLKPDLEKPPELDAPDPASDTDQITITALEDGATSPPAPSTQQPTVSPPPDGGLQAWLQVLGSFAVMVATWGLVNTFGVYQTYYETSSMLVPRVSASAISWIGSVQASLLLVLGLVSGPLYDAGHFRSTLTLGLVLVSLGMFLTSLATKYWHLVLAQGVCVGLGMGLAFLPSTAVLAQYFSRRRALAIGVASTGSPLAGIVFPILFSRLETSLGFGWATRVIAFVVLALSAVPVAFMRVRTPPVSTAGKRRPLFDRTALSDPPFLLFCLAGFSSFLVLYVPFFYTQLYTIVHGLAQPSFAPYLVTFLNAGSVLGRVLPALAADRYGSLTTNGLCTLLAAALAFSWLGCSASLGGLTAFALLYGAFSGGVVALAPSVVVGLSYHRDPGTVGVRMGMCFAVNGVAVLVGAPVAGAVLGRAGWTSMIVFTGVFLAAGAVLCGGARWVVFRERGAW